MTKGDDCTVGATHTADIQALQARADRLGEEQDKMWDAIDRLRNRLPLWATVVISILSSAAIGLLVALAKG